MRQNTTAINTTMDSRSSLSSAILVIVSFAIPMVFSVTDACQPRTFCNLSFTSLLRYDPSRSVRSVCASVQKLISRLQRLPSMFPTCRPSAFTSGGLASSQALQRSNLAAANTFSMAPSPSYWEDDRSCHEAFVSTTQVSVSRWLTRRTGLPHYIHSKSRFQRSKVWSTTLVVTRVSISPSSGFVAARRQNFTK